MRDPFPAPAALVGLTHPFTQIFALKTLPYHIHEILPSFCFYKFIEVYAAPRLSAYLFPTRYNNLPEKTKHSWNVHVVSMVQAIIINSATIWIMVADTERGLLDWRQRVWGYSGATGMVQALAAGYFLWDVVDAAKTVETAGLGLLVHAISSLTISMLGFRPFVNYYGLNFVLYELSTPFLNVHWFCDKLGLTGSRLQLFNGIALIVTFGSCRILWGSYSSVMMFRDVWKAIQAPEELPVPSWLAITYLTGITVLGFLNVYWFGRMIQTVRSRFTKPRASGDQKKD